MARRPKDRLVPDAYTDAELVAHVLENLGISQRQLADLLGLSAGQVCKLVANTHKVHPSTVRLLGLIMEVPGVLTWLLEAQELLYGPGIKNEIRPYTPPTNYSGGETADWLGA